MEDTRTIRQLLHPYSPQCPCIYCTRGRNRQEELRHTQAIEQRTRRKARTIRLKLNLD